MIAPFPIPRPDDAEVTFPFPLGPVGTGWPAELEPARAGLGLTTPKDAPDERLAPRPDADAEPDADADADEDSSARDVGYTVGDVVDA